MDVFFKVSAGALLVAILSVILSKEGKEYALILCVCACAMILMIAVKFLQPILSFLSRITQVGELNTDLLSTLLKIMGIGLVSQIAGMLCTDAGNQSLAKALQIFATTLILWTTLPLMEQLIMLIESIMEAI